MASLENTGTCTAVIGAGVVGMSCALELQRRGRKVIVVDRQGPGTGTSFGNAGVFATGHVLPIGMPGVLARVPKMLLDRNSPLSIRWSYLPQLSPWLYHLVRASQPKRVEAISLALRDLVVGGLEAYKPLLGPSAFAELVRQTGWLMIYRDEKTYADDRVGVELRRRRGVRVEEIDPDAVRQLAPALSPEYRRARLMPDCGHTVNPFRLVQTLADLFRRESGTIVHDTVCDFEFGEAGPRRLMMANGSLDIGTVVLAAGPDSAALAAKLGSPVPLIGERGYHVTLPRPGVELRIPLLAVGEKFGLTPMEHGLRLAGIIEFDKPDAAPQPGRHQLMIAQARRILPGLVDEGRSTWVGRRPSMPDSLPVIGRSPFHRNSWFAFGHGHIGLTTGAVTGRLIADLVTERPPAIDIAPFRVDRFASVLARKPAALRERAPFKEWVLPATR